MADFCKQCSIDLFSEDNRDLAGVTTPEVWTEGKGAIVICERCGIIQVDPDGNCASTDCLRAGKPGHGVPGLAPADPVETKPNV